MKPLPQSLVDRAKRLATHHQLQDVATIIGVHPSQITRMRKRGWKAATYRRRPRPSDFDIQAQHLSFAELCKHYGAGTGTVARWFKERRPRPSWRGRELTRAARAARGASRPMPSPTLCSVCYRTIEYLDTACARADCPLRPRRK